MKTITPRQMRGDHYVGGHLGDADNVIVSNDIPVIIFDEPLNIKGLISGSGTNVYSLGDTQIRQARIGGQLLVMGNLFCGNVDSDGSLIIKGDLNSWIADITCKNGDICVTGNLKASGDVKAPNGAIVVNGRVNAEGRVFSLDTWSGHRGEPCSGLALGAAERAKRVMSEFKDRLKNTQNAA